MTGARALERRRMTAEEWLAILVARHRWQSEWDPEADESAVLTFESTIAEWRDACDLVGWRDLGRALAEEFQVDIDQETWRGVLTPPRERTLRDVCELLAARGRALRTRPIRVLGRNCPEAGAFFGILRVLSHARVPCALIYPSTRLAAYTLTYTEAFVRDVYSLAPGTLRWVEVPHRVCRVVGCLSGLFFLLGWLPLYLGEWLGSFDTACVGAWTIVIGVLGVFAAGLSPPKAVVIEGVETFGDLARVVCGKAGTASRGGTVEA